MSDKLEFKDVNSIQIPEGDVLKISKYTDDIETILWIKHHSLKTVSNTGGTVSGTANGNYPHGTTISLTATPSEDYSFHGWIDVKTEVYITSNSTYTFSLNSDAYIRAEFKQYISLSYYSEDSSKGTVSGTPTEKYSYGTSVTINATPNDGYLFQGWFQGGTLISTNASLSFQLYDDINYCARFSPKLIFDSTNPPSDFTFGKDYKLVLSPGTYRVWMTGAGGGGAYYSSN